LQPTRGDPTLCDKRTRTLVREDRVKIEQSRWSAEQGWESALGGLREAQTMTITTLSERSTE
jgi:hypothetical protein